MRGEQEYPFLHSSHQSAWLSVKRAKNILVPFSCRCYLFAGWQHVRKTIKNQNPGAWSWVIIHLLKTWKEQGAQLSVCKKDSKAKTPCQHWRPVRCGMRSNREHSKGAVRRQKCQSRRQQSFPSHTQKTGILYKVKISKEMKHAWTHEEIFPKIQEMKV